MTNATIPQIGVAEISDIIVGVIVGLIIVGFGTFVSWYIRRKELRTKLYSPLWLACDNLLLLFDKNYGHDETRVKDLFNSAVMSLNNIMNSYGTTLLKGKLKESGKDYSNIFLEIKRSIDLNQTMVNSNWALAVICFENAKERIYTGNDNSLINKIEEFKDLYDDLNHLKELCERKDKSLKGGRI
jgi:hypothetical protein